MKKIAIIGGSGFVGTRLVELLKEEKDTALRNIDIKPSRFHPEITRQGDVLDKDSLVPLLKGADAVVLLAAEHRDDVSPVSRYYEVNVEGMRNVLAAMEAGGVGRIVFTSSVAVYGLDKPSPAEDYPPDPFNHYGRSKWQAEQVLRRWSDSHPEASVDVVRPTVIFGERNRGNVYNLLGQISGGRFLMVGGGRNKKSMAYVGNVAAFIAYLLEGESRAGYRVWNYADKPDLDMNQLVAHVGQVLDKRIPRIRIPYPIGMLGGYGFDALALLSRRKLPVSSVRVRKFCATTQFDSTKALSSGFPPPFTLGEGLERTLRFEFSSPPVDDLIFESE
jgi:nucleoside-diphosphate-sugar epimerase